MILTQSPQRLCKRVIAATKSMQRRQTWSKRHGSGFGGHCGTKREAINPPLDSLDTTFLYTIGKVAVFDSLYVDHFLRCIYRGFSKLSGLDLSPLLPCGHNVFANLHEFRKYSRTHFVL